MANKKVKCPACGKINKPNKKNPGPINYCGYCGAKISASEAHARNCRKTKSLMAYYDISNKQIAQKTGFDDSYVSHVLRGAKICLKIEQTINEEIEKAAAAEKDRVAA